VPYQFGKIFQEYCFKLWKLLRLGLILHFIVWAGYLMSYAGFRVMWHLMKPLLTQQ